MLRTAIGNVCACVKIAGKHFIVIGWDTDEIEF